MKAILCKTYGPPHTLVLEDLPSPSAGPDDVVISVKAASLNFPDVLVIENKYQVKPPLPFSPGSELAGVVKEVGKRVTHVKPGDRVMAATIFGAFAEEVKLDGRRVLPLPRGMSFEEGSSLLLTYGTADLALSDRGALQPGETLLVLGAAGGVGLAMIEVGKALGAHVIAAASTDDKLVVCQQRGADAAVNYATEEWREQIKALTDGRGVDVICDIVGGTYTEPALRSMAWRGRLLVIGFAAGDIPKIPLNLTLLKGCSVVGVYWGEFTRKEPARFAESVQRLARWYEEGKIRPYISATFRLEHAAEALQLMAARKAVGKIVLRME